MAVQVTLKSNASLIKTKLNGNIKTALTAMGTEAVGMIVDQMQTGYGAPIRKTGDLMRDVSYEVERSGENTVDAGNTLEYGPYVHDGTSRVAGRPYVRDALTKASNVDRLKEVTAEYLKKGFE